MKFLLLTCLPALAGAVTFGTDCGGDAAMGGGGHVDSLEDAGYEFVVQTLVIDPTLTSISLETESFYSFDIRPPQGTQFVDVFIRAELGGNKTGAFLLEPVGGNVKFAAGCNGDVQGLSSTDMNPKATVKGKFSVRAPGAFAIDVTVVEDAETAYYTQYTFSVGEELPDVPTVQPKLVTPFPSVSPTTQPPSAAPVPMLGNTTEAPVVAGESPITTDAPVVAAPVAAPVVIGVPVAVPVGVPVGVPVAVTNAPVALIPQTENSPTSSSRSVVVLGVFAVSIGALFMV